MGKNVHVTFKEDKWWVKLEKESANDCFNTKAEAFDFGRELAMKEKSELIIHNKDGKISEKNSYGNDPRGTKG